MHQVSTLSACAVSSQQFAQIFGHLAVKSEHYISADII